MKLPHSIDSIVIDGQGKDRCITIRSGQRFILLKCPNLSILENPLDARGIATVDIRFENCLIDADVDVDNAH